MTPQPSNSKTDNGSVSTIINKLPPKILFSVIIVGILAIAVMVLIAVQQGREVNLWVLNIGASASSPDTNSVSASDLNKLSGKYFESKYDKEQLINVIRQLIDKANDLENFGPNLYYKIAMAQIMIQRLGQNSIDTRITDKDQNEAYKKIQVSLKAIGFYEGEINGDQGSTNRAVTKFQERYNKVVAKRDIIPPGEFGCFGYYTCFAIGKWARTIGTEPGITP
jgi:hypothetical protein